MIWCNKFISAITSRLTKAQAKRATVGSLSKEYQMVEEPSLWEELIFYKTWVSLLKLERAQKFRARAGLGLWVTVPGQAWAFENKAFEHRLHWPTS